MKTTTRQRSWRAPIGALAWVGCLGLAGPALADDATAPSANLIAPGAVTPMPGKGPLPHRQDLLALTFGGSLFGGDAWGGEALGEFRFAEAMGLGVGARASSDGVDGFLRMDAVGLAINHWAFLGFADLTFSGTWGFGGAMVAPVKRDDYLRLSFEVDENGTSWFGLGLEHDVW